MPDRVKIFVVTLVGKYGAEFKAPISIPVSAGGRLPDGALQTHTDFGAPGYGGPCPPQGDHPHRYLFTVFAVKIDKLNVTADTSAAVIGFNLQFNS